MYHNHKEASEVPEQDGNGCISKDILELASAGNGGSSMDHSQKGQVDVDLANGLQSGGLKFDTLQGLRDCITRLAIGGIDASPASMMVLCISSIHSLSSLRICITNDVLGDSGKLRISDEPEISHATKIELTDGLKVFSGCYFRFIIVKAFSSMQAVCRPEAAGILHFITLLISYNNPLDRIQPLCYNLTSFAGMGSWFMLLGWPYFRFLNLSFSIYVLIDFS